MSGWAATNTLRKCIEHDDLLRDKALAAVALVETALDAEATLEAAVADLFAHVLLPLDNTSEDNARIIALDVARIKAAAALRAVREGK